MRKQDTSLMAYVGRFNEQDLMERKDKEAIDVKKEMLPAFRFIYCEDVKKRGQIVALDVWLSSTPV